MAKIENARIKKGILCTKCGNDKVWLPRGDYDPQYQYKCTKCGNTDIKR